MLSPGKDAIGHATYERHRPEQNLLYKLIEKHYPVLIEQLDAQGKSLPLHVHQESEAYHNCGRLEHGFLRVRCDNCHFERLVAFSCKKRRFCPNCWARRMAETAALLAEEVFSDAPLRQWVISFPYPLRFLFAAYPQAMGKTFGWHRFLCGPARERTKKICKRTDARANSGNQSTGSRVIQVQQRIPGEILFSTPRLFVLYLDNVLRFTGGTDAHVIELALMCTQRRKVCIGRCSVTWEKTCWPVYMLGSKKVEAHSMARMAYHVQVANTHESPIFI